MKRCILTLVAVIAASAFLSHARAAPPTVTPSPGYDARLQEQRAARSAASQGAATSGSTGSVAGHHVKKAHHRTH